MATVFEPGLIGVSVPQRVEYFAIALRGNVSGVFRRFAFTETEFVRLVESH